MILVASSRSNTSIKYFNYIGVPSAIKKARDESRIDRVYHTGPCPRRKLASQSETGKPGATVKGRSGHVDNVRVATQEWQWRWVVDCKSTRRLKHRFCQINTASVITAIKNKRTDHTILSRTSNSIDSIAIEKRENCDAMEPADWPLKGISVNGGGLWTCSPQFLPFPFIESQKREKEERWKSVGAVVEKQQKSEV